ncbi:hypothetical protein [Leptolyngbya iicbica]|uniref:DUF11 domain-containing protein n=2 Tax=Cyanophyceae TaxID=3028117 RepID=A0A4Q7E4Z2_9CYAN|nr:hypothetical protein [Leptolyngbya sp. LK]RZM76689.1 hypothetical protein DYY88_18745 [Leptolyngbya sp. LK]
MNQRAPFLTRAIAHLKALLTLCFAVLFSLSSLATPAWANQPVFNFQSIDVPATPTVRNGVNPTTPCSGQSFDNCDATGTPTAPVNINFGSGNNLELQSIDVGVAGNTFIPDTILRPPFGLADRVEFRRAGGNPPERALLFYEIEDAPASLPATFDVVPDLAASLQIGMLSNTVNRGIDNLFNNIPSNDTGNNIQETGNNIERVDYIIEAGVDIPIAERDNFGFLVIDRGGNDPFGIAAITELNGTIAGNPAPSDYGELQVANVANYGAATVGNRNIRTLVASDPVAPFGEIVQPSHIVGPQPLEGQFFSIADLLPGDTTTTRIFGYSLFAADVPVAANLVNFNTFPTNTPQATGGLDLVAGGALFRVEPAPEIGVAKTNSAPRPVPGQAGFFDIDLTLRVTNTGNTALSNVQLEEDLEAAFINNNGPTPLVPPAGTFNPANGFSLVGTPTINFTPAPGTTALPSVAPTIQGTYTGASGATSNLFVTNGDGTVANPSNRFNVGDTAVVGLTVRLDLGTDLGGVNPAIDGILVANNQASTSGFPPGGTVPVNDLSQDGTDVDPDGTGPGNNNDPTPIQIPFPSIGVAKSISAFRPVAGTTQYDFDFTIIVTNSGSTILDDVELEEDLQDALITSAANRVDSFTVTGTPTVTATGFNPGFTPPTGNAAYNGNGNIDVFTTGVGVNSFNPGASTTTVISVRADLGSGGPGPLNDGVVIAQNTATASGLPSGPGVPPGQQRITDDSQNGGNVDPDGDGNPGNNNQPTPIQFPATTSDLVLVKRITNIFRGGSALSVPGINNFNDQAADPNDAPFNSALGGGNQLAGIFELPNGFALEPNDEAEYTVYFWNSRAGQISQLQLCDELQPPSVLNTGAPFQIAPVGALGTPNFSAAGNLLEGRSPGAPLDGFCPSAPVVPNFPVGPPGPTGGLGVGAGGGVVAGPFNVPSNQFGAIRFRVRIP